MTFTDTLIDNLSTGIDRFILRALSFHKGKENAVSRAALLDDMHRYGMNDGSADPRPPAGECDEIA